MSETDTRQSRPNRPKGKQNTPKGLRQWKQDFFREVGWKSKIDVQNQLQNEMVASCAAVETHFNPDPKVSRATALGQDDLDAGPEFKAFLAKLELFEKADLPRSQGLVEDLRAAAQTYLDHYDKHFDRQKKQPKTQRKADACREVLADLRGYDMRQQLVELGDPPWQSEQALQASELKAMLDLESLPAGQRVAEPLDGRRRVRHSGSIDRSPARKQRSRRCSSPIWIASAPSRASHPGANRCAKPWQPAPAMC